MKKPKRGLFIVFFGTDGSGKSTVADKLIKSLSESNVPVTRFHWRPRVLPPKNKEKIFKYDVTKPDDMPSRPLILSLILYLYFYLDFLLGYFKLILPGLRKGEFVIYERYFYDVLVHPVRYRLKPMNWLGKILSKILPSPDLMVILHGDPEVIYGRKKELPIEEIERQQSLFKKLFLHEVHAKFIDVTSMTPDSVVSEILETK